MSEMRKTMESQPEQLARLLADSAPAEAAAARLAGRRLLLIGIGTSWHAAQHGVWMLREAGSARSTPCPSVSQPCSTGPGP